MTVDEILTDAKEMFHDFFKATNAARTEISNAQWVRWLNEWVEETAIVTKNPKSERTATSDSGRNYDLPGDFLAMITFKFRINGGNYQKILYVPFELMETKYGAEWEDAAVGVPVAFTFPTQDTFYIHPTPNTANRGTDFMLLNYVYRPVALSERVLTATPAIHGSYHRTAKYFLAARAHMFLGNPNIARDLKEEWLESIKGRSIGRKDLIEGKIKTPKRWRWG